MSFDTKSKRYIGTNADRLAYLAILVSTEATERQTRYTSCAKVPWYLIDEIRAALNGTTIDWRDAVRRRVAVERERKRKETEARRLRQEAEIRREEAARSAQEGTG